MVPVPVEEIHAGRADALEEGVDLLRLRSGIYDSEEAGEQSTSGRVRFQPVDGSDHPRKRASPPQIEPEGVGDLLGPIQADRDTDLVIRANVDHRIVEQGSVGLQVNPAGWHRLPQSAEQAIESLFAQEERLTAVEDDAERSLLRAEKFAKLGDHRTLHLMAEPLRLPLPAVIPHVEDIAIGAIEVAPTGDLEEDGVNVRQRSLTGSAVMPVVGSVIAPGDGNVIAFVPNLFDQPGQSRAINDLR